MNNWTSGFGALGVTVTTRLKEEGWSTKTEGTAGMSRLLSSGRKEKLRGGNCKEAVLI